MDSLGLEQGGKKSLRNYHVPETIINALVPSHLNHRAIHEVPHAIAQVRTLQLLPLNRVALCTDKEPTKGSGSWRIILYIYYWKWHTCWGKCQEKALIHFICQRMSLNKKGTKTQRTISSMCQFKGSASLSPSPESPPSLLRPNPPGPIKRNWALVVP